MLETSLIVECQSFLIPRNQRLIQQKVGSANVCLSNKIPTGRSSGQGSVLLSLCGSDGLGQRISLARAYAAHSAWRSGVANRKSQSNPNTFHPYCRRHARLVLKTWAVGLNLCPPPFQPWPRMPGSRRRVRITQKEYANLPYFPAILSWPLLTLSSGMI